MCFYLTGSKLLGHLLLLLRLLLVVLRPSRSRSCCCSCSKPRRPKQVQVTCGRLLRCLDIAVRRYHKCRSGCSWLLLLLLGLLLSTPWYGGAITGLLGSAPAPAGMWPRLADTIIHVQLYTIQLDL